MSKAKVLCCAATAMLMAATAGAAEEPEGASFGATADFFSKYIWRGQNVVDDWVVQPGAFASYKGFTASIWGNVDATGETVDDWEFSEIDYAFDYSNSVPGVDILGYSLGVIYYDFPNTDFDATGEAYGVLTLDVPLSPAARWFYDFDEADGSYVQFSLGHTVEKVARWSEDGHCDLELGASLGYGTGGYDNFYFGVDDPALNDVTLSAGLPICMGPWTIKPLVAYSTLVDDDIRSGRENNDNLWGGVSASVSF